MSELISEGLPESEVLKLCDIHGEVLEGHVDFSGAKDLLLWCNGMSGGQTPRAIKGLLKLGYPAEKIKWYRGGMQSWSVLGFTTVTP